MMLAGPNAASPPKNTPGRVDMNVVLSTTGMSHLPNSSPMLRSMNGNALSCPIASTTVSHGRISRPMTSCFSPWSVSTDWNLSNSMPVSLPSSMMKRTGWRFSMISTPSSSASSSSHGEALKYFRVLRAITLTSVAPSRFDDRQQSIAVLPTPMISTRLPTDSTWPKWIDSSQSMPMKIWSVSWRPGISSSLPFGAPLPTNTASNSPESSNAPRLSTGVL